MSCVVGRGSWVEVVGLGCGSWVWVVGVGRGCGSWVWVWVNVVGKKSVEKMVK